MRLFAKLVPSWCFTEIISMSFINIKLIVTQWRQMASAILANRFIQCFVSWQTLRWYYNQIWLMAVILFQPQFNTTASNYYLIRCWLFINKILRNHVSIFYDDVMKWKKIPRYWPFVRGIHCSPKNSPHKDHWCGALMFSLVCARING